ADQRNVGSDPVAADPMAVQGGGPARVPAPAHPRGLRVPQERLHGAHRTGAGTQGKSRSMTVEALIGLIMLLVLLGAIFIGVPISFTLLFLDLAFGYFGMGETGFDLAYLPLLGLRKEELLGAVPLFIFSGFITEQAGLMERLFRAFRLLLAPLRGSLYLVVILTSTVFAMATGIVGAAVTVLGVIASPLMVKTGYYRRLS